MIGVLLINLGTPAAPTTEAVRSYLAEFLMDPYVIDLPLIARWTLVHGMILRTRPARSAEAYQKIWGAKGSPLMTHHLAAGERLQSQLGNSAKVICAMRYGTPSISAGVQQLRDSGVQKIIVLPMYPQYSLAATESSIQCFLKEKNKLIPHIPHQIIRDFYEHPGFVDAVADIARKTSAEFKPDFTLFSYHGLPERQVEMSTRLEGKCSFNSSCCEQMSKTNRSCYRAQCYATTRAVAARLGLSPDQHSVSFQSRLGRTPWIKPHTDIVIPELAKRGIKRLAVLCPSFVADCLETLEEIGIRARDQFRECGGEDLRLIPCVNSSELWAQALKTLIQSAT